MRYFLLGKYSVKQLYDIEEVNASRQASITTIRYDFDLDDELQ